ncbi:MAG: sulfatase-like hydrolase/transferase [Burkholderiales bacterium]|nr:sulfatase-like hydrolase/transferase [Burkholderiales bacterium]
MASRQPNFILFITDQHRADHLGCYGHPVLRTPNIDRIAARGVAMDRFYVASPVCMPNRASLMTGRLPSAHGVRSNGIPLSRQSVTFVDLLAAAGYRTALIGKSHLQNFTGSAPRFRKPEPPPALRRPPAGLSRALDHGLEGTQYEEENPNAWASGKRAVNVPFYGFQHVELVTGHGDQCGGDYLHWLRARHPEAERLRTPAAALAHGYACPQAVRTALPEALYPTNYIRDRTVEYLRNSALRDKEAPFFLMVSFPDPHHPFTPPGRYWDMYEPGDMPRPAAFARADWRASAYVERLTEARANGTANVSSQSAFAVSEREALEARALTCGMIGCIDEAIGEVLSALEASGRREDTVLVFMSDHGDYLGDHRILLKGPAMYQAIVRTPFIWADPSSSAHGRHCGALGSTLDVPATILERARLAPYSGMQGVSLLGTLEGGKDVRDGVLVQYDHQVGPSRPGRMLRTHALVTRAWRLSMAEGIPGGELYNLQEDPEEFFNLWDERKALEDKCGLLAQLARTEMESVDELPLPSAGA